MVSTPREGRDKWFKEPKEQAGQMCSSDLKELPTFGNSIAVVSVGLLMSPEEVFSKGWGSLGYPVKVWLNFMFRFETFRVLSLFALKVLKQI